MPSFPSVIYKTEIGLLTFYSRYFIKFNIFSFAKLLLVLHRNRNLKTSKALLKSQAHQGTSLFTSAATNQREVSKGGVKRSSGPNSRVPEGDRVAVRVGVVEMGRGNDQKGQGRRD